MRFCIRQLLAFALGMLFLDSLIAQENLKASAAEDSEKSQVETREKTIYIPFSKLKEVFEKEGRGVFIPYDQFQELWKAAKENRDPIPKPESPVDAIITSISSEAVALKDVVQVDATMSIELIKKGWLQIPIKLRETAIQSATIDGQTARVVPTADGGYQLLIENKGDGPTSVELKLRYAKAFAKSPGKNMVHFDAPQSPVNRWRIRIPQPGVKVNVQPMIAATDAEATELDATKAEKETVLLAFVGAAPQVAIDWTPKSEGAIGMTALTVVQAQQEIFVNENNVRTRANLQYAISRGELTELQVEIPSDQKVVNVFDSNVRKWEVSKEGDTQTISVQLFEPVRANQSLMIELEQLVEADGLRKIKASRIRALDVGRQQGVVVINIDPSLRGETTNRTGLMQVDAIDLPPTLASQAWSFAFRYSALPFELTLSAEKVQPRISVLQLVESYLEPEQLSTDLQAIYNIEDAGVFQLELAVPTGFEVVQVVGRTFQGADAAAAVIDSFHRDATNNQLLLINLAKKALGKTGLLVRFERRLNDPNLLTPTGTASTISLELPQAKQSNLTRAEGRWMLHAPESLRIIPNSSAGLRSLSFSEVYGNLPTARDNRFPLARPSLAFAFSDQAATIDISVERRKSFVTARQRMKIDLDNGVARYESLLLFDILYSGTRSLRVDVPADIAADIRNNSPTIREAPINPQPADLPAGYVAWALSGETELIGSQSIVLTWERKLEQLEIGKSLTIAVPAIRPMQVDRAWGQIVVTKSESLDVLPSGEIVGLRPIDPTLDVIREGKVPNASRAFEFHDDWKLSLSATRYQLEEVKRTSIERGLVRTVITRSNQHGVQALYRIRSARQRLAVKLPEGAQFDAQPSRINGQPVALERGDKDQLFIPLIGMDPNTSFLLDLRYTLENDQQQVAVPEFPEEPAVQKIYFATYLPKERAFLGSSGPWTEEFTWTNGGKWKWIPQPNQSEQQLFQWVKEGVDVAPMPLLQTDGIMYLFSTLRPQPPPDGLLRFWTLDERWLAACIVIPLFLIGILLLRFSLHSKAITIAAIFIGIISCGVFIPTFGRQLLNQPLYIALAIVGVTWATGYFRQSRMRTSKHSDGPLSLESAAIQPLDATSELSSVPTAVSNEQLGPTGTDEGSDKHE